MNYRLRLASLLAFSPLVAESPLPAEPLDEDYIVMPEGYLPPTIIDCSYDESGSCVSQILDSADYGSYSNIILQGAVKASHAPAALSLQQDNLNVTIDADLDSDLVNAHGLHIFDNVEGSIVRVNGSITTEDDAVSAIKIGVGAENNLIVVSSDISSPIKTDVYVIDLSGTGTSNNEIILNETALVQGRINMGTGNRLVFNVPLQQSYAYSVEGDFELSDTSGKASVVGSAYSRSVADIKDTTHRLYERFGSLSSALASHYGEDQSRMWTDGYYHKTEREVVGNEVKHEGYGVNAGYHLFDKGRPWDLTINAEFSETKYGQAVAGNELHAAESKSVLVGLTTPEIYKPKFGTMSLTLLAGIESVESELLVANNIVAGGFETVSDDYNSIYLVAGSKWLGTMSKDKVAHDVALGVDLIHERTASHDASAHFTMNERNLTQLNASASYQLSIASSGKSSIYGGGEVNYAKLIQGEDQDYTIRGETTNTKVTHTDDKESESYYKGVLGLALNPSETSHFYVSAQMLNSNVDIDGYGVSLGFKTTK